MMVVVMAMYKKPKKITPRGLARVLLDAARSHRNGYVHYTTLSSLEGMVTSRKIHLSSGDLLNDLGESLPPNTYVLSFAFGTDENLAMWGLYGVPNKKAVRVTFPHVELTDWLSEIATDLENADVYAWNRKKHSYERLSQQIASIRLIDVAYHDKNSNYFCFGEKSYRVDKTDVAEAEQMMQGCLKAYGWRYENEVRLLVTFDSPVVTARGRKVDVIALDFAAPIEALLERQKGLIFGPWGGRSECAGLHRVGGQRLYFDRSKFHDLVHYRCNDKMRK